MSMLSSSMIFRPVTIILVLASFTKLDEESPVTPLISEFQPNPVGDDPDPTFLELSGTPGEVFSGVIVNIESDPGTANPGDINSFESVSGTFDANGLLTVSIADLENPSFTIALLESFTGTTDTDIDTDDDGVADDLSTFGTVFDAIGVPDVVGDEAFLFGAALGGTDFAFTGDEPGLIFRDASVGELFAINEPDTGEVFDVTGTDVTPAIFDPTPTLTPTFGAINPTVVDEGLPDLTINELRISSSGDSDDDSNFVEVFGAEGTSLDGISLVVLSGEFAPGNVDFAFDLSGSTLDEDGFVLVANPGIASEIPQVITEANDVLSEFDFFGSPATFLLVSDFMGTVGDDLDAEDDGTLDVPIGTILDSVSLIDDDATPDLSFSETIVGPDGAFPPAGIARDVDGSGDFQLLAFGSFAADTPGFSNEVAPLPLTPIYEIQGAGHISPLNGEAISTTGIVTTVDTDGFYLQDPTGDGDDATSDGIFVFTGSAPSVDVGDELEVTGTVEEFIPGGAGTDNLSITNIVSPTIITLSTEQEVPAATILGTSGRVPPTETIISTDELPVNLQIESGTFNLDDGIDFYESLEGMLVTVEDAISVGPTDAFGGFSTFEFFVAANQGAGVTGLNSNGGITITDLDPDNTTTDLTDIDFNPERIQIDALIEESVLPQIGTGTLLGDLTGVVSYNFGNFEVLIDEAPTIDTPATPPAEVTTVVSGLDQLTIASYNVLNLDPNDADGDTDVADGRFDTIATQIVNNLQTPDIIGLQEVQDNDGSVDSETTAADATLQALIDAIAAIPDAPTYAFIDNTFIEDDQNGGEPGGNIRTAYLYNPDRVDLIEESVQTVLDTSVLPQSDPSNPFNGSRLPLVATFEFNGEAITVINNHFSSRGGSDSLLGGTQPPAIGGADERLAQAQANRDFVNGLVNPENVVVLGDLNGFQFETFQTEVLAGPGEEFSLNNLTDTLDPVEAATFIFNGNSQALDHVFVSDDLLEDAEYDVVSVNINSADTPERASDHDPVVASFSFDADSTTGTAGDDDLVGTPADDILLGLEGNDTLDSAGGNDTLDGGPGEDTASFGSAPAGVMASLVTGTATTTFAEVGDFEFIGEVEFPTGVTFGGTEIGGLSGIEFNPANETFLVIADDQDFTEQRFYTADFGFSVDGEGNASFDRVDFLSVTSILDFDGFFEVDPSTVDPESIRIGPSSVNPDDLSLYITSEGNVTADGEFAGVAPFVRETTFAGIPLREFTLPEGFAPTEDESSGIRDNLAFESLTFSPDQTTLFAATENALFQDGPTADLETGSPSRIVQYDVETGEPIGQFVYVTEPIPAEPVPADSFADNGLVELLALSETQFIAVERSFAVGIGNTIQLFLTDISEATDVTGPDGIGADVVPASKSLLFTLDEVGSEFDINPDNIEGITFGPTLEDGRQTLVLVSDNNFSDAQVTQFLAFTLEGDIGLVTETDTLVDIENLSGSVFDDSLRGNGEANTLFGNEGNDSLKGANGADSLEGDSGDDHLLGGGGDDTLLGGIGNDSLKGSAGNDLVEGNDGEDILRGNAGNDTLLGGAGLDSLIGGASNDLLEGEGDHDTLRGSTGNDTLLGGDGLDTLIGGFGDDSLDGGSGADNLRGNIGNDTLNGGADNDQLVGGSGDDLLHGGAETDVLLGGGGADTLYGGADADLLIGGGGADFFVLAAGQGPDTITDYRLAQGDVLGLVDDISVEFTQAGSNTLVTLAGTSELLAVLTGFENTPIVEVIPPVI